MRFATWLPSLAIWLATQGAPLLDLSFQNQGLGPGWGGGTSESIPLAVSVRITELADATYEVGQPFIYEVEVTNPTAAPIEIPWLANSSGLDGPATAETFRGSLGLFMHNGVNRSVVASSGFYADRSVPATIRTIPPGGSVRIRASGSWYLPGVDIRAFLAPTNGRVAVTAILRLQTGTAMASSEPSAAQPLSLVLPQ